MSNMWSKSTEMANGRSLGSSGMTSGGSCSTMVSGVAAGEFDQHACLLEQFAEAVPDGVAHFCP